MSEKKILAICQYYYPENFTITKNCEELVKLGYDVTVLTSKPSYGFDHVLEEYKNIDFEVINNVKIHRISIKPRQKSRISVIENYLSFWHLSKKWIRKCKSKFDVVYSMSLSPVTILAAGNLYKKKHHVKHIVHCVDLWPESVTATNAVKKNGIVYKFLFSWSKKLYKHADEILIGSPSYERYFKDVLKLNNKLTYVPQTSLVEDSEEAFKYGEGFNILYCGNIGILQRIEDVPKIMAKVNDANIKFHIIGMGPQTEKLKDNIKKFNSKNVIYYGPIPSKISSSYFVNADAVYISLTGGDYVSKTIPNKLEMALCFGKPVIGVLGDDGKSIIEQSNSGIVSSYNIDDIVKTIKEMASFSKTKLNEFSVNGKRYYKENFDISIIGKKIAESLF